jgi:hypothetical protein
VNLNRNAATVIVNSDGTILSIDVNFNLVHRRIADFVVCGVDQNFIEDLVQSRNNLHVPDISRTIKNTYL